MSVPVRPAATVMLVHDGDPGLEVLLLRRGAGSVFVPGAHVFPGGAVDADDGSTAMAKHVVGLDDETASRQLDVDHGGLAYWIAAVRETYEEAGLLLATTADGTDPWSDSSLARRLHDARRDVDNGGLALADLCAREGIRLDLGRLRSFGRWITPHGAPRRYDTRFFVAPAPARPQVTVDDREAVSFTWSRPSVALDRFRRDEIDLILPTERSLAALAEHGTTKSLLDWLDRAPPEIDDSGGWRAAGPDHGSVTEERPQPAAPPPFPSRRRELSAASRPPPIPHAMPPGVAHPGEREHE